MILVLKAEIQEAQVQKVLEHLKELGLDSRLLNSSDGILVAVLSDTRTIPSHLFTQMPGVEKILRVKSRYPLASIERAAGADRGENGEGMNWQLAGLSTALKFGSGARPIIIAGPCSVENQSQILDLAQKVKASGATVLRGGAFKPRSNPYDFSGLGIEALEYLSAARRATGLPIVSEVLSAEQVEIAYAHVDIFQVGARNMYNYELLKELGRTDKPILIKRAMSATVDELLQAAEYVLLEGNLRVILCERGIRTFETRTRNTLDLSAVAVLKSLTSLPVIVDPSHGTGKRDLIRPLSRAAIAGGADGLMIEVHSEPSKSISDAAQAITPEELKEIVGDMDAIVDALADRQIEDLLKKETGGDVTPSSSLYSPALSVTSIQ